MDNRYNPYLYERFFANNNSHDTYSDGGNGDFRHIDLVPNITNTGNQTVTVTGSKLLIKLSSPWTAKPSLASKYDCIYGEGSGIKLVYVRKSSTCTVSVTFASTADYAEKTVIVALTAR